MLEIGNKQAIEKRKKSEAAFGFAKEIRDAIDEYYTAIDAHQMGKIMREVGNTMFLNEDIQSFIEFQDGLEGS